MIEHLCQVMPPPETPNEAGSLDEFLTIERELGVTLPQDYKEYIIRFGTGYIGGFLWIFNPFTQKESLNFLHQKNTRLDALRVIKEKYGDEECPYPLYPEAGGLLPWGATDNANVLYWLTIGRSDNWTVVINESRGPLFEEYQESMTSYLTKLISGNISSKIIPPRFINKKSLFVSFEV